MWGGWAGVGGGRRGELRRARSQTHVRSCACAFDYSAAASDLVRLFAAAARVNVERIPRSSRMHVLLLVL